MCLKPLHTVLSTQKSLHKSHTFAVAARSQASNHAPPTRLLANLNSYLHERACGTPLVVIVKFERLVVV